MHSAPVLALIGTHWSIAFIAIVQFYNVLAPRLSR
jgi:hypothetical protein